MCQFPSLKDGKKKTHWPGTAFLPFFFSFRLFFFGCSSQNVPWPKLPKLPLFLLWCCPRLPRVLWKHANVPTGVGRLMPSLNASYSLKQNIMIYSDHSHCPSWPIIPKSEIDPSISKYMFSIGSLCPWILARESQPRGSAPPRRCCPLPELHHRPPRRPPPQPGNGKMWIQWPEKYQLDTLHFSLKCPLKCKID